MADRVWAGDEQSTVPELFDRRIETDPDSEYLDVAGTKLSAGEVMAAGDRFGGVLSELGTAQHDRVASLLENSAPALLTWAGTVCAGRIAVPINTAYKGAYLTHQLNDSGSRVIVVAASYLERVATIARTRSCSASAAFAASTVAARSALQITTFVPGSLM